MPNYSPIRVFPYNPAIGVLIVDKTSRSDLLELFVTLDSRDALLKLITKHESSVTAVSAVYWTPPPKIDTASIATFGFWLPDSFKARCTPTSSFGIAVLRLDLGMCIGLSNLASMSCTTAADPEETN